GGCDGGGVRAGGGAATYAGSGQQVNGISPEATEAGRARRIAVRAGAWRLAGAGVVPVFDTAEVEVKAQVVLALSTCMRGGQLSPIHWNAAHGGTSGGAGSIVLAVGDGGGWRVRSRRRSRLAQARRREAQACAGFPGLDQINVRFRRRPGGAQLLVVNGRRYDCDCVP
ncbi:MAG: hypothetical protein IPJ98_21980, partial [Bryobacterales bacterium]|nr:hypothetical protein [Bryobacterales bacterium]